MTQPKALYLADVLEHKAIHENGTALELAVATELRRLHAELERCKQVCAATAEGWRVERDALLGVLKNMERSTYDAGTAALARAAIAKAEGNT
jgi:hypothetical protein